MPAVEAFGVTILDFCIFEFETTLQPWLRFSLVI